MKFMDMTAEALRTEYKTASQCANGWVNVGAGFSRGRNAQSAAKSATYWCNREQLIRNVAKKRGISL